MLRQLGELLEARHTPSAIVIVGGAALSLLGVVDRPTVDIDVVATGIPEGSGPPEKLVIPSSLPEEIQGEAARLSRDMALPDGWINVTVTSGGRLELPVGFAGRVQWERLGALWLGLTGRTDLIALKLHASADQDPRSRHVLDLVALHPTRTELLEARAWVAQQDDGLAATGILDRVISHVIAQSS